MADWRLNYIELAAYPLQKGTKFGGLCNEQ